MREEAMQRRRPRVWLLPASQYSEYHARGRFGHGSWSCRGACQSRCWSSTAPCPYRRHAPATCRSIGPSQTRQRMR